MNVSIKRALCVGGCVVVLTTSGAFTFAAPQTQPVLVAAEAPTQAKDGGHRPGMHHGAMMHRGAMLSAAARYLGLTPSEIRTQLKSGRTLAQIAASQGKSVQGLKQAMLAEVKVRLDNEVASGKLTQAEAQNMMSRAQQHIDQFINGTWQPDGGGGG